MKKALALVALMASCSTPSLSVVPYTAMNSLEGSVASSGGIAASTDLENLGIDDSESVFGGRIDFSGTNSHWSVASSTSAFDGSGLLDAEFDIGGFEFESGVPTDMSMEVGTTSVMWTYDWGLGDTAHFGLGVGVTALALAVDVTGEVDDGMGGTITETGSMDETIPIPMLGARIGGVVGPVRLEASYGFLDVAAEDAEVSVTDLDVYVGIDLFGDFGSLIAGYREFDFLTEFESDSDSANLDLNLGGPYVGVRIGF